MTAGKLKDQRPLPRWISSWISPEEVDRIESAIGEAESRAQGEIVPVIVRSSTDPSSGVAAVASLFFFGFILLVVAAVPSILDLWEDEIPLEIAVAFGFSILLGRMTARSSVLSRFFVSRREQAWAVNRQAELEFYRAHMDRTNNHVGILLFLSFAERRAVVLADSGIASRLPEETWGRVLRLMTDSLKRHNLGLGLEAAVVECGRILRDHFPSTEIHSNELENRLIIRES